MARTRRRGEKKVADWVYDDKQEGIKIKIPVYMVNGGDPVKIPNLSEDAEISTFFRVQMDDPDVYEEDLNIDALKTRVMEKIKTRVKVGWRSMLLVTISGKRDKLQKDKETDLLAINDKAVSKLNLEWEPWQVAEIGSERQLISRSLSQAYEDVQLGKLPNQRRRTGTWVQEWDKARDGWPSTGQTRRKLNWGDNENTALIEDTPEHRAALEAIAGALEAMYQTLNDLLDERNVARTLHFIATKGLAAIGGSKLLEAGPGKKKSKR